MTGPLTKIITAADDYNAVISASHLIPNEWPRFMLYDPVAHLLDYCYHDLPRHQFILVDPQTGEPLALGNSIPIHWQQPVEELPDGGWDWVLQTGVDQHRRSIGSNTLSALQAVVFGENRGRGLSTMVIQTMKRLGREAGLNGMIAPVRPNLKHRYPLTPIDRYVTWSNPAGLPFDPWLRVHVKLGARIIKPCQQAMTITGTIADWSEWTGLEFPETGEYFVPGALLPVSIDRGADRGIYVEPNVWVHHP
jgi:hypothetical protein